MIRQTFAEGKPFKRSVKHTDEQALKKTLSLQSLAFFFQYEKHDKDMEQLTIDLLLKICYHLNKHNVKYLIVGGTAVGFYGHIRLSHATVDRPTIQADLDFWYNPSPTNRKHLADAILDMGLVLDQQTVKEIEEKTNLSRGKGDQEGKGTDLFRERGQLYFPAVPQSSPLRARRCPLGHRMKWPSE